MSPSFIQMFEISKSGIMNQLFDLDIVSNNLANFNTSGYKQTRSNFQEFLVAAQNGSYSTSTSTGTEDQANLDKIMNGLQISSTQTNFLQGALKDTERDTDLAISGEGFFGVTLPDGQVAYTRNGEFSLDEAGNLVDGDGNFLVWEGTMPENPEDVEVDLGGNVFVTQDDERVQVGVISLYKFPNPTGLIRVGSNLWLEADTSGAVEAGNAQTDGFGSIVSKTLEASNVDLSTQFSQLVILQRGFELSVRALQQSDTMLQQAIQMRQG